MVQRASISIKDMLAFLYAAGRNEKSVLCVSHVFLNYSMEMANKLYQ